MAANAHRKVRALGGGTTEQLFPGLVCAVFVGAVFALEGYWPYRDSDGISRVCKGWLITAFLIGLAVGLIAYALTSAGNATGLVKVGGTADNPAIRAFYAFLGIEIFLRAGVLPLQSYEGGPRFSGPKDSLYSRAVRYLKSRLFRRLIAQRLSDGHLDEVRDIVLPRLQQAYNLDEAVFRFQNWQSSRCGGRHAPTATPAAAEKLLDETLAARATATKKVGILWSYVALHDVAWAVYLAKSRASAIVDRDPVTP